MKKWLEVYIVFMLLPLLFAGMAEANGTLTATFQYTDAGGAIHPLDHAYVYLQPGGQLSPRGQFFKSAKYILGPTDTGGNITASVPEGSYHVRITRRAPLTATPTQAQAYGPPRAGDYTWQYGGPASATITVTTGGTVALGAVNASVFQAPMTISGQVVAGGVPAAGVFVKATQTPCTSNGVCQACYTGICYGIPGGPSQCGPVKYSAFTDSNGNYTINLPNPGTYYIYAEKYPGSTNRSYTGPWPVEHRKVGGAYPGGISTCSNLVCGCYGAAGGCSSYNWNCPVTVNAGQQLTGVNITTSVLY